MPLCMCVCVCMVDLLLLHMYVNDTHVCIYVSFLVFSCNLYFVYISLSRFHSQHAKKQQKKRKRHKICTESAMNNLFKGVQLLPSSPIRRGGGDNVRCDYVPLVPSLLSFISSSSSASPLNSQLKHDCGA